MAKNKKRKLLEKSEQNSKTKPNTKKLEKALAIVENDSSSDSAEPESDAEKLEKAPAILEDNSEGDSSEPETESEKIQMLLEAYTKDKLIEFICDAAIKDSSLIQRIENKADLDVSHRKIFVYRIRAGTKREHLVSAFESFGEIENCRVVIDQINKPKGYGFVLFRTREAAEKALKEPRKKVKNRLTYCQLASLGPVPPQQNQDTKKRKIETPIGFIDGSVNSMVTRVLNSGLIASPQIMGNSLGSTVGVGGFSPFQLLLRLGGSRSVLGAYGSTATALQGLHSYKSSHLGLPSLSRTHYAGGYLSGYPFYLW
ncbi:hypothetical protein HHK36_030626 [Tetracentron sinense]|uniref:RRM domain-containing protein n=1 Tax=Tetracentron sinense TaxID=13715 RepID=A0A834YCG9_TETSI|nr:hypothetical protein HHK36_030626 [Tetracentron sinense]